MATQTKKKKAPAKGRGKQVATKIPATARTGALGGRLGRPPAGGLGKNRTVRLDDESWAKVRDLANEYTGAEDGLCEMLRQMARAGEVTDGALTLPPMPKIPLGEAPGANAN